MKYNSYRVLMIAAIAMIAGCSKLDYKKTKSGLLYKVIATSDTKGELAKPGNILKLYFQRKLNDSVLDNNYGKMPSYVTVQATTQGNDYSPSELFTMVKKGDSAVSVILIDSLVKKGLMPTLPPFMKKGDRIIVSFKVKDLFTSDSLARADNMNEEILDQGRQQKEMAGEKTKEDKEIQDFLAANKIDAQKTSNGVYYVISNPGTGLQADSGRIASMNYRGTTFKGQTFDTNMDSSFHHTGAYQFPVGAHSVIPGLDEGVRFLKKGGKAKFYVPAVLAYGPNPVVQGGKPYENLIFEIELVDVKDKSETPKTQGLKIDTTQRKK
ncbi:MAG TPA: FKBP-type peptidyl-prolyl cis-trans isomerase [Chitinophagaceae bacterium]|nr:FKBP-type peptidyl-prolyl cis-trans isomerase [Chitinophagaceae bacterium]